MVGRKRRLALEREEGMKESKRPRRAARSLGSYLEEDEVEKCLENGWEEDIKNDLTSFISVKEEAVRRNSEEAKTRKPEEKKSVASKKGKTRKMSRIKLRRSSSGWNSVKEEVDEAQLAPGEVIAKIRAVSDEEMAGLHGHNKMGWMQLCPFCDREVGTLVDHVKSSHPDKEHRMIRTLCPFEDCAKMVVDIKNHIRMVHDKVRNYFCDLCDSTFTSNYQVKKHMEGVHSNKRVKCEECDEMFKTTTLESHIKRVHRGEKPSIPCPESDCGKTFGSKADLERHHLASHMKWKAPCPECGKSFRMDTLVQHIKSVHQGIYPFNCEHCDQGFQHQKGLTTHVRTRHQGLFLVCLAVTNKGVECGKVMYSEEGLLGHTDLKHLTEQNRLECPQCGQVTFACHLAEHVRTVHLMDEGGSACPLEGCGYLAPDREGVREHLDTEHPDLGLDWCELCREACLELPDHLRLLHPAGEEDRRQRAVYGVVRGTPCIMQGCDFMTTGPTHLARHLKLEHEEKKPLVTCEQCGQNTRNMEKHIRIKHDKVKDYACHLCHKLFLTPFQLKKHELKHSNSATQPCPECGVEVMNLRQHQRFVHQKDLPFACEVTGCETKFTSRLGLRKHVESVHEGLKVPCPHCQKMVGSMSVASHIKIVHEKRRDYTCPECQKTFQNNSHLRNHVQRVHLKIRVECPDCGKMVQDLHNHKQFVHNKVKNFPCNMCDLRCTTSTALKKHISSVHLGEKAECPQCGDIVAKAYLDNHVRKNHGAARASYECEECHNKFTSKSYLAKHILRVHMEVRQTCPTCGLETKDLYRHKLYTNCGKDGYIPRQRKLTNSRKTLKKKTGDAENITYSEGEDKVSVKSVGDSIVNKTEKDNQDGKSSRLLELHINPTTDFPVKCEYVDIVDIITPLFENEEAGVSDENPEIEPSRITGDVLKRALSSEEIANVSPVPDEFATPSPSSCGSIVDLKNVKFSNEGDVVLEDDDLYFSQEEDEEVVTRGVLGSDPLMFTNNNVKVKKEMV